MFLEKAEMQSCAMDSHTFILAIVVAVAFIGLIPANAANPDHRCRADGRGDRGVCRQNIDVSVSVIVARRVT